MRINTLLREAEHAALKNVELSGSVLDLGGDAHGEYRAYIQGNPAYTTVNIDPKTQPDIAHDLEKKLPIEDSVYDHALLINVLEHIFEHRQLLSEAFRTVRSGGRVVVVMPFLFPVHPSPDDFCRLSATALKREVEIAGGTVESLTALGSGVFAARYVMLDRLMPSPIRLIGWLFIRPLVGLLDATFAAVARLTHRKYTPSDYALGYCVQATKP